jgi:hypothetical protein
MQYGIGRGVLVGLRRLSVSSLRDESTNSAPFSDIATSTFLIRQKTWKNDRVPIMSNALRFAIPVLILVRSSLFAQVAEAKLKSSYRVTGDGAFIVEAGAELKAVFDNNGEACTLTLHGPVSEDQCFIYSTCSFLLTQEA